MAKDAKRKSEVDVGEPVEEERAPDPKILVIVGSAKNYQADYDALPDVYKTADVMVINEVAIQWTGRMDYWASLHGEKFKGWLREQSWRGGDSIVPKMITGNSAGQFEGVRDFVEASGGLVTSAMFPNQKTGGSSGLFAVKVALVDLSYAAVVLCGVPMDEEQEHFNYDGAWTDANPSRKGWEQVASELRSKVSSMSGWTKEQFGEP